MEKKTIKEITGSLKTEGVLVGFIFRIASIYEEERNNNCPNTEGVFLVFIENNDGFTSENFYHHGYIQIPEGETFNLVKIVKKQITENTIFNRKRFQIFKRDSFKCQYCGRSIKDGAVLEVDHIIPKSRGGTDEIDNLITSCRECNRGKKDKLLNEQD